MLSIKKIQITTLNQAAINKVQGGNHGYYQTPEEIMNGGSDNDNKKTKKHTAQH